MYPRGLAIQIKLQEKMVTTPTPITVDFLLTSIEVSLPRRRMIFNFLWMRNDRVGGMAT
jgi:hypothetical protein